MKLQKKKSSTECQTRKTEQKIIGDDADGPDTEGQQRERKRRERQRSSKQQESALKRAGGAASAKSRTGFIINRAQGGCCFSFLSRLSTRFVWSSFSLEFFLLRWFFSFFLLLNYTHFTLHCWAGDDGATSTKLRDLLLWCMVVKGPAFLQLGMMWPNGVTQVIHFSNFMSLFE